MAILRRASWKGTARRRQSVFHLMCMLGTQGNRPPSESLCGWTQTLWRVAA